MANVATLLQSITLSGSRLSDGTPNQTGTLSAYLPGTLTPTTIWSDPAGTIAVTQPVTLDNGGRIPVASYANGIYTTTPVRLIIKDVSGNTVSDVTFVGASAGNTGVNNASWPSETTVDSVLTALGTSLGGTDGNFLEHAGATNRSVQSKFREIWVSVKDYGAAGDNLTDDTAAIQNALNRAVAIGSGTLYFPPGTYKISSSALALSASVGIGLVGAGYNVSTINQTSASTSALTVAAGNSFFMRGLTFTAPVVITNQSLMTIDSCGFVGGSGGTALSFATAVGITLIRNCSFSGNVAIAAASATNVSVTNSSFTGTGASAVGISLSGVCGQVYVSNCQFTGTIATGIKFGSGMSGTTYNVSDCPTLGGLTTPFDTSAIAYDPGVIQRGNGYDVEVVNVASTPVTIVPRTIAPVTLFNVTGTAGGTVTISPIVSPANGKNTTLELRFCNRSGGTITWVFTSGYDLSASIPTGSSTTTTVGLWWDTGVTKLQERYRGQV